MLSEDGRKKIIETNQNRPLSPQARAALMKSTRYQRKRVKCHDTGRVFKSLMACAAFHNTSVQALKYRIAKGLVNMEILE